MLAMIFSPGRGLPRRVRSFRCVGLAGALSTGRERVMLLPITAVFLLTGAGCADEPGVPAVPASPVDAAVDGEMTPDAGVDAAADADALLIEEDPLVERGRRDGEGDDEREVVGVSADAGERGGKKEVVEEELMKVKVEVEEVVIDMR